MMKNDPSGTELDTDAVIRKRFIPAATMRKRPHSLSPTSRIKGISKTNGIVPERRCQSLSPSKVATNNSTENVNYTKESASTPVALNPQSYKEYGISYTQDLDRVSENDLVLPQTVLNKIMRGIATKKREFYKIHKTLVSLQNSMLEQYAALRELETRARVPPDESLDDVRILNVKGWPAHDLMLLCRNELAMSSCDPEIVNIGNQVLDQFKTNLSPIPETILNLAADVMASRIELLSMVKGKNRVSYTNMEWKTKNLELDQETERLHRMVAGAAENIKAKINHCLGLVKVPWLDRDTLTKRIDRLHRENMILQHKLEEIAKNDNEKKIPGETENDNSQTLSEELSKERAAREALKEVISAAESMLRVARSRIATLERQLKDTRSELEAARRRHKDLEQLYRHRETSFDARSRKLLEVSKTGEITIEALSRQRDALELRVKEFREMTEKSDQRADIREAELKKRVNSLQTRAQDQEKQRIAAEARVKELELRLTDLEEQLRAIREKSVNLVDIERKRCIDFVPSKEKEPSDRETEIWKELQLTRVALSRAEEELRLSRADKDSFLESLSRIAQGENNNMENKMATELLNRERKIMQLQRLIDEQKDNEKIMEESMTQYENELAALRLEVKRLRNYDCYVKEIPYQQLQTELLELHMQVETLSRERTALITAAASRALMLERNERSAELFARITKARRELAANLAGTSEPPCGEENLAQISRSLTSLCINATEKWSALRAERARVLRLESAVVAQALQLDREGRVRTQLERRRSLLEREVLRTHVHSYTASESTKFSLSM